MNFEYMSGDYVDIFEHTVHLYSMSEVQLTKRQQEVLSYIKETQNNTGSSPTFREIASHFGFSSPNAATAHIKALRAKGVLDSIPSRARALRPAPQGGTEAAGKIVIIPIYGSIPAGLPSEATEENDGCVLVDVNTIGVKPTARTFALKVRGSSMIGKHIIDGDLAIIEHGVEPRTGDVVAALIDGQVTLKTFVLQRSKPYLKAENPKYPDLIPQQELQIQGVMVALVRKNAH
jgi:repressor LexA